MKLVETAFPEVKLIDLDVHGDARGHFVETYDRGAFHEFGITDEFVLDGQSLSTRPGTVRALHFQVPPMAQPKLVRCAAGSVFDVVVDLRVGAETYGRHVAMTLAADVWQLLYIPAGFAHGFCTLEPDTRIVYKLGAPYSPEHAKGIQWNDPALGIDWPVSAAEAVLSDADRRHPTLADFPDAFRL